MSRLAALLAAIGLVSAAVGGAVVLHAPAETPPEEPPLYGTADYTGLHEAGVTGENVTVGIVDPSGFDLQGAGYTDSVLAAQAFGDGKTLANGGTNGHGTTVAETVTTVAPDSELYLAAFGDESDYRDALAWFAANDVDVVVLPTSFYGKSGDGTARSIRATSRLARDTVVIAASGNLGESNWRGGYVPDEGSTMTVRNGGDPVTVEVSNGRVRLWLSWTPVDERYRFRLVRNGSTVATSEPYPGDSVPNHRIDAEVAGGTYEVVIDGPANATGTTLRLEAPGGRLENGQREASLVAPATARGVTVVGAYDAENGTVPTYSGVGPTADGRNGVDVIAPASPTMGGDTRSGTSYAAAYAAGVSALVMSADGSADPTEVERALERSAVDLGPPGWDAENGHGLVDSPRAVAAVRSEGD
ncbi:S8 family serine peptidase [Natronomonas sp.]|uniref:S8 family serine peptidase n=1 Tax=Natronomonas sp. TaxID=2184060 RepID=UPI002FC2F4AB